MHRCSVPCGWQQIALSCMLPLFAAPLVQAEQTSVLVLKMRVQAAERGQLFGSSVDFPAYEFAELLLTNNLGEPLEFEYDTALGADGRFVPIVRDHSGAVVSTGCNFAYSRSPPGAYHLRIQFHRNGTVWESNEIEINHN
jgi:hypothetical protein